jgi:hypothetical protein
MYSDNAVTGAGSATEGEGVVASEAGAYGRYATPALARNGRRFDLPVGAAGGRAPAAAPDRRAEAMRQRASRVHQAEARPGARDWLPL